MRLKKELKRVEITKGPWFALLCFAWLARVSLFHLVAERLLLHHHRRPTQTEQQLVVRKWKTPAQKGQVKKVKVC